MKICKRCNKEKDLNNFELSYSKLNPINRRSVCKKCRNKDRAEFNSRFGFGLRTNNLRRLYGITPQDYLNMSEKQENKCYICQKINDFGPWQNKLVVDHCHKTGTIRALLCDKCNKGLGQFNDDPELLIKASIYLKKFIP